MDIPQMTLVAWVVVGGWVASDLLKIANVTGINLTSIVVAVVGSLIVIAVYQNLGGRRRLFGHR